jgi:phosphoglycerate dehydrogenase-like enzyme
MTQISGHATAHGWGDINWRKEKPMFKPQGIITPIITPHMAALTRGAAAGSATMAAEGVLAVINGQRWPHVANPEVYNHLRWKER